MEGKILNANYLANMFYIKDKTSIGSTSEKSSLQEILDTVI